MSDIKFKSTLVDGVDNQLEVTVRFLKLQTYPMSWQAWVGL